MEVTAQIDEDEVLEELSLEDLVRYINRYYTLKDVLATWMKRNRHQVSDEDIIQYVTDEL